MSITINGSGTLTGVSVGGLPDGIVDTDMLATGAVDTDALAANAVTAAKRGAESILQIVHFQNPSATTQNQAFSASGNSFVDTQLTAQITPVGTNSRIFIITTQQGQNSTGNGGCVFRIMRGTSAIGTFTSTGYLAHFNSTGNMLSTDTMFDVDDAANLSGTLTYKTQFKVSNGGTAFTRGHTMTLIEVAR